MKKIVSFLLALSLFLTGCTNSSKINEEVIENGEETLTTKLPDVSEMEFNGVNDPKLLNYVEDSTYQELVNQLDSDQYFVESVEAIYVSKECLEEEFYGSQKNIYFGYTIDELKKNFGEKQYVFDLDENGKTIVREVVELKDEYDKILKNVVVGGGVILVCVTVSAVGGIAGAPAVSVIFASGAKSAALYAAGGTAIGGLAAGGINYYKTGDFDQALSQAAIGASEGFKVGAIMGAGEGIGKKYKMLKDLSKNSKGLTLNEAAYIQKDSKWSSELIKKLHSKDEYLFYKKNKLVPRTTGKKKVISQKIDWKLKDDLGRTNMQRVKDKLNPIGPDGKPLEVHHIGQENSGAFAIMSKTDHKMCGSICHYKKGPSEIDRNLFKKEKNEVFKDLLFQDTGVDIKDVPKFVK